MRLAGDKSVVTVVSVPPTQHLVAPLHWGSDRCTCPQPYAAYACNVKLLCHQEAPVLQCVHVVCVCVLSYGAGLATKRVPL